MKGYELTERGKIIIAVLLVLILIIPALIIASQAWLRSPPNSTLPSPTPTPAANSPLPTDEPDGERDESLFESETPNNGNELGSNGAEVSVTPAPEENNQNDDESNSDEDVLPTVSPTESNGDSNKPENAGPINISVNNGTMAILFFPTIQTDLDEASVLMLDDFLSSPKNTSTSMISVDIPRLSETDRTRTINAILRAFELYGVTRSEVVFFTTAEESQVEYGVEILFWYHFPANDK